MFKPEIFRLLFAMIAAKNCCSVFVYVEYRSFVRVATIWKTKLTLNQVNRRTTGNGIIQAKQLHWNRAERNENMISIRSERHEEVWIESHGSKIFQPQELYRTHSVGSRKHLTQNMKFICFTFSLITIAITWNPFSRSDRTRKFLVSKEHFQNLAVRCDWST